MASTTPIHDLTAAIRDLLDQIDGHADAVALGTFTVPVEEPPETPAEETEDTTDTSPTIETTTELPAE